MDWPPLGNNCFCEGGGLVHPIYDCLKIRCWQQQGRPIPSPHDVKMQAIVYLADRVGASVLVDGYLSRYRARVATTLPDRADLAIGV
jgi:hypothetical protein